jgi:hypothetical protein
VTGSKGATGATGPSIQVIGGGGTDTKAKNTETRYAGMFIDAATKEESFVRQAVNASGTLNNLSVRLSEGPGTGGAKYKMTVMVNGSSTALTCSISNSATTCTATGAVAITAGQDIALQILPESAPLTSPEVRWTATLGS